MSETDEQFVERMTPFHGIKSTDSVRLPGDDFARLFAIADRGADAAARIEQLEAALRAAYEVYAGSDGFVPETCAEGYQRQIIAQMVDCISAALEKRT